MKKSVKLRDFLSARELRTRTKKLNTKTLKKR